ncbi:MAG: hypothetical protein MK111_08720 [Crocosphaera sp.]|uniref:Uncharacterized protein n=2 Tax=Crocosphaera watsonii TaxID=263511 RepID=T2JTD6_CROWT|nr:MULTISPECIES: hypothetical protein [Crocosphaera]MCH2244709.1 hypothetical protein [Crocosphaera sp.]NQZ65150.1 hypothetical protein [Crocosphaera sp.]CCQ68475.1 hypothetical protein CWATWH0402_5457 [Crocosphaera watsonii WH 0402]
MCGFLSSKKVMRFLKVIVCFSLFVIIIAVPWLDVLANNAPNQGSQNVSDTIENVMTMLGGGGIGVAGNEMIKRKTSTSSEDVTPSNTSTELSTNPLYKTYIDQLKTELFKKLAVIEKRQKALHSKLNNIEFFLGKKYQEFDRKDTLH